MHVRDAIPFGAAAWNEFVLRHYPPIGAFMQTWEWGEFQKTLGRHVERYYVSTSESPLAAFTEVIHPLPFGLSYRYFPRGPVLHRGASGRIHEILGALTSWALSTKSRAVFMRIEPPVTPPSGDFKSLGLVEPAYYVQPRFNAAVPLRGAEEEILMRFHPSTRSNIRRAEKRGVTVELKPHIGEAEQREFRSMIEDTIRRNGGANAYPSDAYFRALTASIPVYKPSVTLSRLTLAAFWGYENGAPAAAHLVLFFGDTATYLYGASFNERLRSKVTTYLHWTAMREAKARGCAFYDLGGVDDTRWPSLTNFKRQFRGEEFCYIGNLDFPLRPVLYRAYNILRRLKK